MQGPARFAKLHSEIVNVMRSFVDSTCYAGIRKDKKKFSMSLHVMVSGHAAE